MPSSKPLWISVLIHSTDSFDLETDMEMYAADQKHTEAKVWKTTHFLKERSRIFWPLTLG